MRYEKGARSAAASRRLFPLFRFLAQLALAAAILAVLLLRVDIASVRDQVRQADLWWLPLAFAMNLASDWFRAMRWQQLLEPMKRLAVPFLYGTALLGVACNLALPLRAGEFVRVQVLRRRTGLSASGIVATLISEKLLDMVAFSSFIALGLVLYSQARFLWPLGVAYVALVLAGIVVARRLAGREPEESPRGFGRWRLAVRRELTKAGDGLQAFLRPRALFHAIWTSHAAWLCQATMYYACGRALGLDVPPAAYLLVVVAATIAVSVPITQAGLGVFEIALTGILLAFGVSETQAAAFAIFSHVVMVLPHFVDGPIAALALRLSPADILVMGRPKAEPEPSPEPAVA